MSASAPDPAAGPVIVLGGLNFPEAPRWEAGAAWCVDGPRVWHVGDAGPRIYATLPTKLLLGFQFDAGMLLVAAAQDRRIHAVAPDGSSRIVHDLSHLTDRPINELLVHPNGHIYVGLMGFDPMRREAPRTARMIRIDPDGRAALDGPELLFANGIVLAADGNALLVVESFAHRITRVEVRPDGGLGEARCFADLGGLDVAPDGLCRDAEGAVWAADMRGGGLLRVREGGEIAERRQLPWRHVTSCALGGEDGRSLFFTAADSVPGPNMDDRGDGVLGMVRVAVPSAGSA